MTGPLHAPGENSHRRGPVWVPADTPLTVGQPASEVSSGHRPWSDPRGGFDFPPKNRMTRTISVPPRRSVRPQIRSFPAKKGPDQVVLAQPETPEMRTCTDCGAAFGVRPGRATRCLPCQAGVRLAHDRRRRPEHDNRPRPERRITQLPLKGTQ
jgi:hypothetical protein